MKRSNSKTKGFTLIELIVVIVILGIMAAVAGPKFVNLQTDARASIMKGVEGSVRSAATLIYSKSLIAGTESAPVSTVNVTGVGTVDTVYGYPAESKTIPANVSINELIDLSGTSGKVTASTDNGIFIYVGATTCSVTYAEPAAPNGAPLITPDLSAC